MRDDCLKVIAIRSSNHQKLQIIKQQPIKTKMNIFTSISPWHVFVVILSFLSSSQAFTKSPTGCTRNCDEKHIVIAILLNTQATSDHLSDVKTFIMNSVESCLKLKWNQGRIAINVIDPGTPYHEPWCENADCVQRALAKINIETSAIAVDQLSKNDTQMHMASVSGRELLHPEILIDNRIAELMIITNYISMPFAQLYDSSLELRTNLSHVDFHITIVNAPIEYYRVNSSIPNYDMKLYPSFASLAEADAKLCELPPDPVNSTAAIIVCFVLGVIVVLGCFVYGLHRYKNKKYNRRHKMDDLKRDVVRLRADNQRLKEQLDQMGGREEKILLSVNSTEEDQKSDY